MKKKLIGINFNHSSKGHSIIDWVGYLSERIKSSSLYNNKMSMWIGIIEFIRLLFCLYVWKCLRIITYYKIKKKSLDTGLWKKNLDAGAL